MRKEKIWFPSSATRISKSFHRKVITNLFLFPWQIFIRYILSFHKFRLLQLRHALLHRVKSPTVFLWKEALSTLKTYSQETLLHGIDTRVDVTKNTAIMTSPSLGQTLSICRYYLLLTFILCVHITHHIQ